MRILKIIAVTAAMAFAVGVMPEPSEATEARDAIKMCDKNPKCSYRVNDNGSVDLTVQYDDGPKLVNCPQKGQCACVACRTTGNKGLKANVSSTLTGGIAVSNPSGGTIAKGFKLSGTHSRSQVATACANAGGSSWSNLDSYGCDKKNCDGKGGNCFVACEEKSKTCTGQTPDRVAGTKTLGQALGVKVSGGASPPVDPGPGRKPSALTGGNILDGGGGFGSQGGPASAGTPLSTGRGSSPPPGQIK